MSPKWAISPLSLSCKQQQQQAGLNFCHVTKCHKLYSKEFNFWFLVWNAIIETFWNNSHTPWILYRSFLINYILLAQPDTRSLIFCPSDGSFKCDSNFQNIYFSKNYISCESYREWFPVQWQHWDNYFEGIRPESPVSGHWKSLLLPWSNLVISCLRSCVSQKLWLSTAIEAWCVSI